MKASEIAERDWMSLGTNPYPGRGLVLGRSNDGRLVIVYWLMGRDPNTSANRVFEQDGEGRVFTQIHDPSLLPAGFDTSLLLYNAMRQEYGCHIVSNGDQTDTVVDCLMVSAGAGLQEALRHRTYEPDKPNFTPRITGLIAPGGRHAFAEISVLHKADVNDDCLRTFHCFPDLPAGFGYAVTTYAGDGKPIPKFRGDPLLLPLRGLTAEAVAYEFWDHLSVGNRVSIAAKMFHQDFKGPVEAYLINKHRSTA